MQLRIDAGSMPRSRLARRGGARRIAPVAPSRPSLRLVALACVACQSTAAPGTPCARGSDCAAPLVCAYGRCRSECDASRDCPAGSRCIASAGLGICSLDVENHCDGQVCPSPLVCIADECRTACSRVSDCLAGACEGSSCVEPISGVDGGAAEDAGDPDASQSQPDAALFDAGGELDAGGASDAGSATDAFFVPRDAYRPDGGNCRTQPCPGDVLISEVLPGTGDYFVELYVPGHGDVDLDGCMLSSIHRIAASQDIELPLGSRVHGHGFYAIGASGADFTVDPTLLRVDAANGAVALSCHSTVLDEVGWGTATFHEGTAVPNPPSGRAIERRASDVSTGETLAPGGSEEHAGNGYDTDDNAADFVVQPTMQTRASAPEPP